MSKFIINYEDNDILDLTTILDEKISELDEKIDFLKDFKNELLTYLSENKEV